MNALNQEETWELSGLELRVSKRDRYSSWQEREIPYHSGLKKKQTENKFIGLIKAWGNISEKAMWSRERGHGSFV